MQNWQRQQFYIQEIQNLIYNYYGRQTNSFNVTYWNINKDHTVWDNVNMFGGAYEKLGHLSGLKFNKYLTLPCFFFAEFNPATFLADDKGYYKEDISSFIIPSFYGITPYEGDGVKIEQDYLNPNIEKQNLYIITGKEAFPNTETRFWKLTVKPWETKHEVDINDQVIETKMFYDYDKKIHSLSEARTLTNMLIKDKKLKQKLDEHWNSRCGLYFI